MLCLNFVLCLLPLLCLNFFHANLPCCTLIFFRAHLPCCDLNKFFFARTYFCCAIILFFAYPAVPQFFFSCTSVVRRKKVRAQQGKCGRVSEKKIRAEQGKYGVHSRANSA